MAFIVEYKIRIEYSKGERAFPKLLHSTFLETVRTHLYRVKNQINSMKYSFKIDKIAITKGWGKGGEL